jgi:predicted Rossmann fold flavoprotein
VKTDVDVLIIGGGAAGFFTAINLAEAAPGLSIAILERGNEVLSKVRISGGGRCNVTHAEFDPLQLASRYPRGQKELLGPFHHFMTGDTIAWFEARGIALKIEEDGRMFPITDSSQTIIDCFLDQASKLDVGVYKQQAVKSIEKGPDGWLVCAASDQFRARQLVVASGSSKSIWKLLEGLGHTIVRPVPSLFTFNIADDRIAGLAGIAVEAEVQIIDDNRQTLLEEKGPLLITHWGMSGPAILKLSAWGARLLEPLGYQYTVCVNWLNGLAEQVVAEKINANRAEHGRKKVVSVAVGALPKRLWQHLVKASGIHMDTTWAELTGQQAADLADQLTAGKYQVTGKSTFKDEFVTAGGVELKEVNFKTFASKLHSGLYFAGEVLDIDAVTGGFNFQNAWTGGYLVAQAIAKEK